MTDIGAGAAKLEIGRVVTRTVETIRVNPVPFLVIGLVYAVPIAVIQLLFPQMQGNPALPIVASLLGLAIIVVGLVVQPSLIQGAAAAVEGRKMSMAEMLGAGVGQALPFLGLMICLYFGVFLGLFLFVVPGVILGLAWSTAPSVLVLERRGVFESLSRSAVLTRNCRWMIFLLFVVFMGVFFVAGMVLGVLNLVLALVGATLAGAAVINIVMTAVGAVIGAAGQVALYSELRMIKEGAAPGAVASIFE